MKKITLVKTKQKQQRNFKFVRLSIVYLFISSISGTSNVCRLTADCPLNSFCEPRSGGWDGQCVCQDGYFMRSSGKIRECIPIADYGELWNQNAKMVNAHVKMEHIIMLMKMLASIVQVSLLNSSLNYRHSLLGVKHTHHVCYVCDVCYLLRILRTHFQIISFIY
jgi:hypothetical protein